MNAYSAITYDNVAVVSIYRYYNRDALFCQNLAVCFLYFVFVFYLFQLSQGEYVAPEKIEDVYARSRFISQVFVYGDSLESCLVAIVLLNEDYVKRWAATEGFVYDATRSPDSIKKVKTAILDDMTREGKKRGLMSYEQVKAIDFIKEPFTIENGLMTPTFKARRYAVEKKYKETFQNIYRSITA
jgi:long-chain acyl-CoA synthetase